MIPKGLNRWDARSVAGNAAVGPDGVADEAKGTPQASLGVVYADLREEQPGTLADVAESQAAKWICNKDEKLNK